MLIPTDEPELSLCSKSRMYAARVPSLLVLALNMSWLVHTVEAPTDLLIGSMLVHGTARTCFFVSLGTIHIPLLTRYTNPP